MGGIRPLPLAGGGSYSEPAVFSHFPDFNFFFFGGGGGRRLPQALTQVVTALFQCIKKKFIGMRPDNFE